MNKIMKKISIISLMFLSLFIVGCSDKDEIPVLEFSLENPLRETIELEYVVIDIDEILVNLIVEIYEDGETDYKERKTISLDDDGYTEVTTKFYSLTVDTTYKVVFTGTYNQKAVKMYENTYTTSPAGSEDEPHEISTFEELQNVKNDEEGYYLLQNDIDCEGQELDALFSSSRSFVGDFEGNNYKIYNFTQESYDANMGLFGYIAEDGVVRNLKIENMEIISRRYTAFYGGAIAGTNYGTISNVHVKNVTITTDGIDDGDQIVGGFVGLNSSKAVITNCSITNVKIDLNIPMSATVGGFVGWNQIGETSFPEISNVTAENVLIDVEVDTTPNIDSDTSKSDIKVIIGGFVGSNGGNITDAYASTKIFYYVDNTELDQVVNNTEDITIEETEKHNNIANYDVYVGGFVGTNASGSINEVGINVSVDVEVAYIDVLYAGGFVGLNSQSAKIDSAFSELNSFDFRVGSSTKVTSKVGDDTISLIGTVAGADNTNPLNNVDNIVSVEVDVKEVFNFEKRVKTTTPATEDTEEEIVYTFETLDVELNSNSYVGDVLTDIIANIPTEFILPSLSVTDFVINAPEGDEYFSSIDITINLEDANELVTGLYIVLYKEYTHPTTEELYFDKYDTVEVKFDGSTITIEELDAETNYRFEFKAVYFNGETYIGQLEFSTN